uniref:Putative receptor-like serine/threonine-protein kinase At5g57670 n=1 Tax=Rhizophora mucronata TaxID=61149 RepID=A0A2P2IXR7_RHIMU
MWRATTVPPGCATLTKAQVKSSLLCESSFTPTITAEPLEPAVSTSPACCNIFIFCFYDSNFKWVLLSSWSCLVAVVFPRPEHHLTFI